jgi:type I restriction enzyme R subunit
VEENLAKGSRAMLLAMATGTGKTKLAIALVYRLLAAKRFRRICFVVDRNALGIQAAGEFETTRIVSTKTFADIFGLKDLKSIEPDSETKVHICTIQGLVKRVLFAKEPADAPPIDQYDLMVVDECHRGYGGQPAMVVPTVIVRCLRPGTLLAGNDTKDFSGYN